MHMYTYYILDRGLLDAPENLLSNEYVWYPYYMYGAACMHAAGCVYSVGWSVSVKHACIEHACRLTSADQL